MEQASLTVVTMVEPRLLVVVTGTPTAVPLVPAPVAVELPAAPVEFPPTGGNAVAVVTKVVPLESVVVMAIPPATSPPMVEVIWLPAESVALATRTVAVLNGISVEVTVRTARVVTAPPLLRDDATVTETVATTLPPEPWARAAVEMMSQRCFLSSIPTELTSTVLSARIEDRLLVCVGRTGFIGAVTDSIAKICVAA